MKVLNNLAQIRAKRGISAAQLATAIGCSRQAIYAIESGSYMPNALIALRLADVLDVKMEELFSLEKEPAEGVETEEVDLLSADWNPRSGQPVQLCRVDRKLIATPPEPGQWSLPDADAVVVDTGKKNLRAPLKRRVEILEKSWRFDDRVLMAGCDPGASLLSRHLLGQGVELVVAFQNSSRALDLLKQGMIHIAGTHIRDEATGESNLPKIKKLFGKEPIVVISFAQWEEGIVVAPGNPKGIRGIEDLVRPDVSISNREEGAGSRLLLDSQLARLGIDSQKVRGYNKIALGHLPSARQVQMGKADCCINTSAAARVFGLEMVPLVNKRYDLVVHKKHLKLPQVQAVFDVLARATFRHELEGVGGYDTKTSGTRMM
jgi:molybdate-binding protein/DNA-binding XRE family transcriptional regulator